MKTTQRALAVLTLALLLALPHLLRAGITVSEPPDFSNTAPGTNYNLTTGTNTFSGMVTTPNDGQDNFQVTVPAGQQILSVTATISGASSFQGGATFNTQQFLSGTGSGTYPIGNVPLPAGTYGALVNANFSVGNSWTMTVTVGVVPDYSIINSGGVLTVTNNSNNGDNLGVTQQIVGGVTEILFSASGRTFRVNTGALTNGALVPLSGITDITINGGAGGETFNVGGFSGSSFPSLTIIGGAGNDTVNFTGNLTFASGKSLTVDLQSGSGSPGADTINVSNSAQLVASGNGFITLKCSKNVSLSGGAVLQTVDGNIDIEANQQTTATPGNFNGVNLDGAGTMVKTTLFGAVTVMGTGGDDSGGFQLGVNVANGAKISGGPGDGTVNVTGTGGACPNIVSRGVTVNGTGSAISGGGAVKVTGTGGPNSSFFGIGVSVLNGGTISSNSNHVTVTGTGVGAVGSGSNQGVEIGGSGSLITSTSNVFISATAGVGASSGLSMSNAAAITLSPASGQIQIYSDSVSLDSTASISTTQASSVVIFGLAGNATQINLGGVSTAGVLGLSQAILDRVSTPTLTFDTGGHDLTISSPITRSSATNVSLGLNGATGHIRAQASGTDLSVGAGTVDLHGMLAMPITGTTADASPGYPQLNVAGNVNLNGVPLDLTTGTTYAGALGDQFTIVKNSGAGTTTTGTFAGLPEGAYLVWPGSNTQVAGQITYVGGASGHDVVLTLVDVAQALTVRNTASDTSLGSLQNVLAFAAAHPGADTITFDQTLNVSGGKTITLAATSGSYAITIGDSAGVTIDASSLTNGLTIQGAGPSGNFGLFYVPSGSSLTLRGLTLANGGGSAFTSVGGTGGAIYSEGTTALIGCTLVGNSARGAGAIENFFGTLTLTQCTLSGNSAGASGGGAIENEGSLTVTQCTLAGNSSTSGGSGGAIHCGPDVRLTLTNSIVAGNNASSGADIFVFADPDNSQFTVSGTNIVQSLQLNGARQIGSGAIINAAPNLVSTLGNYGGPTKTLPPLPGSPAIDRGDNTQIPNDPATGLPFTTDQRGKARLQNNTVDIGAVETSAFQVTTAADDGSVGSLRTIVTNQATDITNTITFDASLNGSTIPLNNIGFEISLSSNIAIDASALPGGITISGGGSTRLFTTSNLATIVLTNLTLTGGNGAGGFSSGSGGAIYNSGATLTLNQCTLANNATSTGMNNSVGGAIRHSSGTLALNRCTIANNTSSGSGSTAGGIGIAAGSVALTQCTLSGNSAASSGGALKCNSGAALTLTQCTVAGNMAGTSGGGINNQGASTLTNSIVAKNTAPTSGADILNTGTVTLAGANIIQALSGTAATGPAAINADPLLAPLDNYGGPTKTMALEPNSPARDHATVLSPALTSDQRGSGFPIVGTPDIGAYEAGTLGTNYNAYIWESLPVGATVLQHDVNFDYDGDGVTNFNEFLAQTNPADPASYLHITQITRSGNTVSIFFPGVSGRNYTLEVSTDLTNWTPNGSLSGSTNTFRFDISFGSGGLPPKYFLRVRGGP